MLEERTPRVPEHPKQTGSKTDGQRDKGVAESATNAVLPMAPPTVGERHPCEHGPPGDARRKRFGQHRDQRGGGHYTDDDAGQEHDGPPGGIGHSEITTAQITGNHIRIDALKLIEAVRIEGLVHVIAQACRKSSDHAP